MSTATWVVRNVVCEVGTLSVVAGPDRGYRHELDGPIVRVGTSAECQVRLTDRAVSRLHCELTVAEGYARVRDLGSKNGTWIGAARVHDVEVLAGTELRIGESTLLVGLDQRKLARPVWLGAERCGGLVGATPTMQRLFAVLSRLAPSRETVLVRGESGSGKELVARCLHDLARPEAPFVVIDGSALSRTLAESELFGHARGAFTGAHAARTGALERADGGTLFIDEIGELPLDVQPKLLRFLEDGTVQRLGEAERRKVDARVVAATHRPLERMMNDGSFREDLFHRLAIVEVRVPPLRERLEDVPRIAHALLAEAAPEDASLGGLLDAALAERARYRWPGNVRELRNLVRRLIALGELGETMLLDTPSDPPEAPRIDLPMADAKQRWIDLFERRYLERLLAETGGNVSEAARRADMDRGHLGKLAARHGLKRR